MHLSIFYSLYSSSILLNNFYQTRILGPRKKTTSIVTKHKFSPIFIIINGLQKFKKLRYDEDFAYSLDSSEKDTPRTMSLNEIVTEGPALGIYLIVSIDNYNNIGRSLSRKALSEFEMRVLLQMSANALSSLNRFD